MTVRPTSMAWSRLWLVSLATLGLLASLVPVTPAAAQDTPHATIDILSPDRDALPNVVAPGDTFTVTFTTNRRGWTYEIRLRPVGDDGDGTPAAGVAARGTTVVGQQTVTVTIPDAATPGNHDLVVHLLAPARDPHRIVATDVADATLQAIPSVLPTTGHEDRGGESRTTHEEELAFLAQLADLSPRIRLSQVGTTVEGRPMHVLRIGFPAAPDDDETIANGRSVLFSAMQHGNEPSGREAALAFARDLAFTRDMTLLNQLNGTTVLVLPSANSDGGVANTRQNANRVDINRDHLTFYQPETQVQQRVHSTFRPDILVDAHERPGGSVPDMELMWPRNLNVDTAVRELSKEMVEDYLFPMLQADGWTTGYYGSPGGAGNEDERIKRNAVGLRHSLGLLTETGGRNPLVERVEQQRRTYEGVLEFHRERFDDIVAAVDGAPSRRAADGAARAPFYLRGADNWPPEPDDILSPAPCGYLLHVEQLEQIETTVELHGIEIEAVSEFGRFATMAQPMMTVIPLLFDARANYNLVNGLALDDCSDPGSIDPPAGPAQYSTDFSTTAAGSAPDGWSSLWRASSWIVQDDPRFLRHTVGEDGGRRALVWDEVGDDGLVQGDVEVAALVRTDDTGATMLQVGLHYSGSAGSENGYYVDLRSAGQLRINSYTNGVHSTLATSPTLSFPAQDGVWYHVVLQRQGSALRAKIWPDGQAEPSSWNVTATHTGHSEGYVGMSHFTAETVNDFAFFGVGTGGRAAPRAND